MRWCRILLWKNVVGRKKKGKIFIRKVLPFVVVFNLRIEELQSRVAFLVIWRWLNACYQTGSQVTTDAFFRLWAQLSVLLFWEDEAAMRCSAPPRAVILELEDCILFKDLTSRRIWETLNENDRNSKRLSGIKTLVLFTPVVTGFF